LSEPAGSLRRIVWRLALVVLAVLIVVLWVRQGTQRGETRPQTVTIYSFSIMEEVLRDEILPAFKRVWAEQSGEQIEFIVTFAGSGRITDEILRKLPAEIAILSSEFDAYRLVENGVVLGPVWRTLPHGGVVSRSPMVLLVRPANPAGVRDFADLARPGLAVLHPDPVTSGGGEWAILSVYGEALRESGDRSAAEERLAAVWSNVISQPASARAARLEFERGMGDALITYEKEALDLEQREAGERVYPASTLISEHVVCKIARHVTPEREPVIDALIRFLWSEEAQASLARHGFRRAEPGAAADPRFPVLSAPIDLAELGGARAAKRSIVDGLWKSRILPRVQAARQGPP